MGNNEKNNLIDELLKDYNEQKKAHEDNFGEIEKEPAPLEALPQIEKRSAPKADEKMQESTDSPAPRRVRRSHLSARSVLLLRRGVHRTPAPSTHHNVGEGLCALPFFLLYRFFKTVKNFLAYLYNICYNMYEILFYQI